MIYLTSFCFGAKEKKTRTWERCIFVLEDIKRLSELSEMTEPIIEYKNIERRIIDKFTDDISLYPKDKYLIVHSGNVNPCEYVLAILEGKGLKDYDTIK